MSPKRFEAYQARSSAGRGIDLPHAQPRSEKPLIYTEASKEYQQSKPSLNQTDISRKEEREGHRRSLGPSSHWLEILDSVVGVIGLLLTVLSFRLDGVLMTWLLTAFGGHTAAAWSLGNPWRLVLGILGLLMMGGAGVSLVIWRRRRRVLGLGS
jgi:hypothetical protein